LISVTVVLVTLLFAGSPDFACAASVPGHDCCPNGPLAPCSLDSSVPALTDLVQPCCSAGVAGSIAVAADDSSSDSHKLPTRVDVPVIAVSSVVLPSVYLAGAKFRTISTTFSRHPSSALLYLSTGRLRL
jgi:hypothetical protein